LPEGLLDLVNTDVHTNCLLMLIGVRLHGS
jgi:hypothetical protein